MEPRQLEQQLELRQQHLREVAGTVKVIARMPLSLVVRAA